MRATEPNAHGSDRRRALGALVLAASMLGGGCATLPPMLDVPKTPSTALVHPEATALGKTFGAEAERHRGLSGFGVLANGPASFALHLEMAARAERTLDVQYFLLHEDETGKLLLDALLEAADRGVRVRLLLDDAHAFDTGSMIRPLSVHPNIEIRIFNPWVMRSELQVVRWAEFAVGSRRLNYRMHNKVFVADNAIAITGGRNIGDPYFQASNQHNLGDFDLVVAGPMVRALSRSFDQYWNDKLAVPVEALGLTKPTAADVAATRRALAAHKAKMADSAYMRTLPRSDELADLLAGREKLIWAHAQLAYDAPEKAQVERDLKPGTLIWDRVAKLVNGAQHELIIISPYLVPGNAEMAIVERLRQRGVRVRLVTNSLASTDMPIAHAGYIDYRVPLLKAGCELYEVRPVPGEPEEHGLVHSGGSGAFGLHAKVFVVDRERVFVGSMNFDQRSLDVNTEIGIIVDSPKVADDVVKRFDRIIEPANSYRVTLRADGGIEWTTKENGRTVSVDHEPDVEASQLALIDLLSLLPIDSLL
jgi:putative cardiolipin synthase